MNKPNYGIDAPYVIRNMMIAAIFLPIIYYYLFAFLYVKFGYSIFYFLKWFMSFIMLLSFLIPAALMIWSSKIGKLKQRDKILDLIQWQGNELVLDIGCGRGLLLIGAAKRLTTGKAIGIDIWNCDDLNGNSEQNVIDNAKIENVLDRIQIKTAKAQELPFGDNCFDLILSSLVLHNIYDKNERKKAFYEIFKVLKPGGKVIIQDIQHTKEYESYLKEIGFINVKLSDVQYLIFPPVYYVTAEKIK